MAHEYCCCAIPLLNFGIYVVLLEQFAMGIVVGTLSVATPTLVGAALPSFAPWILAVACYIISAVQVFGFLGVKRENPKVFSRYIMLNTSIVCAAFGIAAAFVGISWARHNTAVKTCISDFFQNPTSGSSTDTESQTLCKIFSYITAGIMTGLLILLGIVQFYFLLVTRSYGKAQREDHKRYFSVYGEGGADDILLDERPAGDTWDARSPPTSPRGAAQEGQYQHVRTTSNASTIMNEPFQQPNEAPYEHYHSSAQPSLPRYSDDDDGYANPPAGSSLKSHPPGGYEYNQEPPQSYATSSYTTPAIPADQPRYQLYDRKV